MTVGLKPYRGMKDPGVPCLGEVPNHWDVRPIGRIGQLFKGNGASKEDEVPAGVPCVRYGDLYTRYEFFIRDTKAYVTPERASDYTQIRYGDVLFAASGETVEDIGRSAVNLIQADARCGGDVIVLRPHAPTNPRFLGYAADSDSARYQKAAMGRGFTVIHIYASQLKQLVIPLPPLDEQAAIVKFLDHADRRIRRYIAANTKLIKLLEEQKQAIIHRAVTCGLDPDVRLKPSGVEWLGDIPAHWEVRKLGRTFRCTSGSTPSRSTSGNFGGEIPWVKTGELLNEDIHGAEEHITEAALRASPLPLLPVDTVLLAMYGQGKTRGRTGLLKVRATTNQASLAILPNAALALPEFLQLWLISRYAYLRHISEARNATQPNLNAEMIKSMRIPLPSLSEQKAILATVRTETGAICVATDRARQEIILLREYRTRLIAEVVTGKLDVREAAARLPEEVDDVDAIEELDDLAEDEEMGDEDDVVEEVA